MIIFFAFLSVSADLSPSKIILYKIQDNFMTTKAGQAMTECVTRKMEVEGVKITEQEIAEETRREEEEIFTEAEQDLRYLITKTIRTVTYDACELEIFHEIYDAKIKEMLLKYKKNSSIDENLDCYKAELKKLKPDSDLVKNFNGNPTSCNLRGPRVLGYSSLDQEYKRLKITKCSLEEFRNFYNPELEYAFRLEIILLLKTTEKSIEEVLKFVNDEKEKMINSRIKCFLDQIFDRN
jgi:hypothetical protein